MKITIAHLYPDLLNLYGDLGNIRTLYYRLTKRGFEVEIKEYAIDETIDFENTNIIYLGGGSDKEQLAVTEALRGVKDQLHAYVEAGGVMLATCSGFEILGNSFETDTEQIEGLGIIDIKSIRDKERHIGDIVLESDLVGCKIVGFENHNSCIDIGSNASLGKVLCGFGNDGKSGVEGVLYKNVVATLLHGPLLPKNPALADYIILKALEKCGESSALQPLDDTEEIAAHDYMVNRLLK